MLDEFWQLEGGNWKSDTQIGYLESIEPLLEAVAWNLTMLIFGLKGNALYSELHENENLPMYEKKILIWKLEISNRMEYGYTHFISEKVR